MDYKEEIKYHEKLIALYREEKEALGQRIKFLDLETAEYIEDISGEDNSEAMNDITKYRLELCGLKFRMVEVENGIDSQQRVIDELKEDAKIREREMKRTLDEAKSNFKGLEAQAKSICKDLPEGDLRMRLMGLASTRNNKSLNDNEYVELYEKMRETLEEAKESMDVQPSFAAQ